MSSMLERVRELRNQGKLSGGPSSAPKKSRVVVAKAATKTKMGLDEALKVFGHTAFRDGQREAIEAVLTGTDGVLGVMPTGGGKSLIYQLPSLMSDNLTIVISPLIALMKDQVDKLQSLGVNALLINSSLSDFDIKMAMAEVSTGGVTALYVSPERFSNPSFNKAIENLDVDILAVDEAHCISRWGHDFRPAYAELGGVIERIDPRQVVALTATATPRVQEDICHVLGIDNAVRFVQSVYRPNLELAVIQSSGNYRLSDIKDVTSAFKGETGIIYTPTKKEAEEICGYLKKFGVDASFYHAGLTSKIRAEVQENWSLNGGVVVATCAFGMGIDRADVRFVIHSGLSQSLEDWYQEIGRAGRDGKESLCITFCNFQEDYRMQTFFIGMTNPSGKDVVKFWNWIRGYATNLANGAEQVEVKLTQKAMGTESGVTNVGACIAVLKQKELVSTIGRGKYLVRLNKPSDFDVSEIDRLKDERMAKLNRVCSFYRHTGCRYAYLCEYFGDDSLGGACGTCDVCNP